MHRPMDVSCADLHVKDVWAGFRQVLVVVVVLDNAEKGLSIELVPGLKWLSSLRAALFV
jgi:hypothetical protein